MRCLLSLALALFALEVALTLARTPIMPVQAMCPEPSSEEEALCVQACRTDDDCLNHAKCCPSACGRSCKTPLIVSAPKAGRCPQMQALMISQPCKEQSECSRDDQCTDNRKCCFSQCAMRCLDPILAPPVQRHRPQRGFGGAVPANPRLQASVGT
ncbi:PREDICTED: whey acidic protein-like [Galeopterus variegatus]|uniref:Whey acidic protein-like n=1 Tax=Galeopterus variegatus TaxID=482537 RepID=A0ABM0QNR8_GALVR|nr:PREDICTED: whey acidic protein-like [Galeopterus variegatus]